MGGRARVADCGAKHPRHRESSCRRRAGLDPGGYAAAIDGLARLGALPPAFAARFRAVAGFRNVLVHGYLDVDVELVAEVLAGRLDDFEEFARRVENWLDASPDA